MGAQVTGLGRATPGQEAEEEELSRARGYLSGQRLRGALDDGTQIIGAGLLVERAPAVGQQLAHHRDAPDRDRPGLKQVPGQLRQLGRRLTDPRLADGDTRRPRGRGWPS